MKYIFAIICCLIFSTSIVFADGNGISSQSSQSIINNPTPVAQSIKTININDTTNNVNLLSNFIWALFGAFFGSLIALLIEKYREPKLTIIANEEANADNVYPLGHRHQGERWKFFRVTVMNEPIPKFLSWLISRETAQQVSAKLTIHSIGSFKGRWASTLELVGANPLDINRIINFPDPVTIAAGEFEFLDVFTKNEQELCAYGWNNEAYLHDWKTPHYRMDTGDYLIDIVLTTLNGIKIKKSFNAHISTTIDQTNIKQTD